MKLLTRDTDYAVRALCLIADNKGKVVPVSSLVEKLKTPRPFLRKSLQVLSKRGILKSYKGLNGGFKLALKPEKIFLSDLIKIFQDKLQFNECFLRKKICPNKKTCTLKKKLDKIERQVVRELELVSIASLLR